MIYNHFGIFNIISKDAYQYSIFYFPAKHGLWRLQENGHIREYRKKEKPGLPPTLNPNSATTLMDNSHEDTIWNNYAHFLEGEGARLVDFCLQVKTANKKTHLKIL